MPKRQATLHVSFDFLENVLHLPRNAFIVSIHNREKYPDVQADMVIESPDLPEVPEDENPPVCIGRMTIVEGVYHWEWQFPNNKE